MADIVDPFRALLVSRDENKIQSNAFVSMAVSDLMEGDTLVRVTHSTVNYKDGLAVTGRGPVVRTWPLIPGIDFAGVVVASDNGEFSPGDAVILNGWGVGELHHGAYAQMARVKGDWLIKQPDGLSAADCMAVGTAGYTAMLAVLALEDHGVSPDKGPVIVTGAAGGVGSMAIALLAHAGYQVIASTGRPEEADYLTGLGAAEIIERAELSGEARPLDKERWAGGIDSVGSHTLANLIAMTQAGGTIAACGLAGGMDLPTTVAPFILRGVTLAGINSVTVPKARREQAWARIASDLDRDKLSAMTRTIALDDVETAAADIVDGRIRGRVVVRID